MAVFPQLVMSFEPMNPVPPMMTSFMIEVLSVLKASRLPVSLVT